MGVGVSMIKSEGGNGWREEEMLNYKVMVRKPIWQSLWKSKAYRIEHHTQPCAAQSQLCFQQQDSGDRVKASACHPHRKPPLTLPDPRGFFLPVILLPEADSKTEFG